MIQILSLHKSIDELANAVTEAESKAPEDLTEYDKMALLGRPKSGENTRAQLRIKESKEFKVIDDVLSDIPQYVDLSLSDFLFN